MLSIVLEELDSHSHNSMSYLNITFVAHGSEKVFPHLRKDWTGHTGAPILEQIQPRFRYLVEMSDDVFHCVFDTV